MTKEEVAALIEEFGRDLPERMSGNAEHAILADRLADVVRADRLAVVHLMRDWLAVRIPQSTRKPGDGVQEGRLWLSLEVAKKYGLSELRSDVEALVTDVRSGNTFLPYYADMIEKYLRAIPKKMTAVKGPERS